MNPSKSPRRMRTVAGLVGGGIGLALVTGVGPAPSFLAAASGGDSNGDSTTSTSVPPAMSGNQVVDAAGAGTVTFRRSGADLTLVSAVPARGWRVEVEQAAGAEIEADFRQGSRRVQVNLELEDGAVRERIRIRDEADGSEIRIENGVRVRTEPGDRADDRVGDDNSNRGPGSGAAQATDDQPGDDHGGVSNSGPGSGDHGADDLPGDDHGGHSGSDG